MKTHTKLFSVLLVFVGLLFLACAIWHLIEKYNTYKPNPIRPKDFPEILVAPEAAVSLDYSTPLNSKRAPHTYSLSFIVYDRYPSEKTRNFVKEHLKLNGWQRLNYHLLNPEVPIEYPNVLLYELYRDANASEKERCQAPKPTGGDWPLRWMENWLSKNDEHIDIIFEYVPLDGEKHAPPTEENLDLNRLYVNMTFFGQDSWVHPHISRYKELHPEEFDESTVTHQPENK